MAKQTMIDTAAVAGNASECLDLSGYANGLGFTREVDELDSTTVSDLCHRRLGSLKNGSFNFKTLHDDGGQPWDTLQDLFGAAACHFGWVESNASMAEQDRGVFLKALESSYEIAGNVGELVTVNVSGNGDGPVIYGQVLQEDSSLASTGASAGFQFGALAAGETLHCVHWVYSITGTITSTIESSATGSWGGEETTRASFTAATAATCEEQTVAGAVTDTYWRYEYTIATGPAVVLCMIGKE